MNMTRREAIKSAIGTVVGGGLMPGALIASAVAVEPPTELFSEVLEFVKAGCIRYGLPPVSDAEKIKLATDITISIQEAQERFEKDYAELSEICEQDDQFEQLHKAGIHSMKKYVLGIAERYFDHTKEMNALEVAKGYTGPYLLSGPENV